jgi:hypothetical protein
VARFGNPRLWGDLDKLTAALGRGVATLQHLRRWVTACWGQERGAAAGVQGDGCRAAARGVDRVGLGGKNGR